MRSGTLIGFQRNADDSADESKAVPITAATDAPSDGAAGVSALRTTCGGDRLTADVITARLRAVSGNDATTLTVCVWDYSSTTDIVAKKAWCSGSAFTAKFTGDADGGAKITIPLDGSEERIYLQVTAIDGSSPAVFFDFHHGEHSEMIG